MLKTDKTTRKIRSSLKPTTTPPAFLIKTYDILENSEYSDIISWNREGDAFIVKKQSDFAEKVLPKYFKHNNFQSFVRQLNMYDFHKSRQENHENIFKHNMFKRGHKDLLRNIKRKATFEGYSNAISSINGSNNSQLAPLLGVSGQEFDIERYNKDYNVFMQELINLKNKQEDLQHVTAVLIQQNNEIISENKILWTELLKNRDKKDKKFDKFIQMLMQFFMNSNSLPQIKTSSIDSNLESPKIHEEEETKNTSSIFNSKESPTFFETKNDSLNSSNQIPSLDSSKNNANILSLCNTIDDSNEKFIKKLLKKLKNARGIKEGMNNLGQGEFKFSTYLENYYEKNMNLLQNLMKYVKNNGGEKDSECFSKILSKRSAEYDISNSLKYLDDSIFNKRKKMKKIKGKKDLYDTLAPFHQNYQQASPFFKKEHGADSLKVEPNVSHSAFGRPFFQTQNKMITNYPNNPQNFSPPNSATFPHLNGLGSSASNYHSELFPFMGFQSSGKHEHNSNILLNSPYLEPSLSRKNSVNCVDQGEDINNNGYQSPGHFTFDSPLRVNSGSAHNMGFNQSFSFPGQNNRMNLKDEVFIENDEQRSTLSLSLDKIDG